jgi:tetratricopeptide (TPR) repeat protein
MCSHGLPKLPSPRKGPPLERRVRPLAWFFLLITALSLIACGGPGAGKRARLLADKGQTENAIQLLTEHLAEHPEALEERRLLIRLLGVAGDLGRAEREALELERRLGPRSPVPWLELGHAHELAHRFEEALALYDRASDVAPKDPRGPVTAGLRAARWGEAELAETRLGEGLRRNPRDARAWHALGLVRVRLGDLAGAKVAYQSGLQADAHALENRVGLASLALKQEKPGEALEQYDAIVAARPTFADAELGRSLSLIKLGRLDEAKEALSRARQLGADPRSTARQSRLLEALLRERAAKASTPRSKSSESK